MMTLVFLPEVDSRIYRGKERVSNMIRNKGKFNPEKSNVEKTIPLTADAEVDAARF